MKVLGIYTYEIIGIEKLQNSNKLIAANHPTLIDVVFLLSIIKNCNCIVKESLIKNIFTKGPLLAANYIINLSPQILIEKCSKSLQNESLLIFPEGTRSEDPNKVKFMKGVANIAISSKKNITPIIIKCNPVMLQKKTKWYIIPFRRPHFTITILDDFDIYEYINPKQNKLMSVKTRHLTKELEIFFNKQLNN